MPLSRAGFSFGLNQKKQKFKKKLCFPRSLGYSKKNYKSWQSLFCVFLRTANSRQIWPAIFSGRRTTLIKAIRNNRMLFYKIRPSKQIFYNILSTLYIINYRFSFLAIFTFIDQNTIYLLFIYWS